MADRIALIQAGKISLVEEKEVLMKKLGGKKMTIFFEDELEEIPNELAEFHLELSDNKKELVYHYTTDGNPGIVRMLEAVKLSGLNFYDMKTEEKHLEEIFINLIK